MPHTLETGRLLWPLIAVAAKPVLKDDLEQHLVGAEGRVTTTTCPFLLLKTPDNLRTCFSPRAHQQQAWDVRHVFPKTCFHFETIFKEEKARQSTHNQKAILSLRAEFARVDILDFLGLGHTLTGG